MLRETRAVLVVRERVVFDDGTIFEIKVWRLPDSVSPIGHGFKYSLFYGQPGKRLIGHDNERGKGDHRHYGDREETYQFKSIEQLLDDFQADVERLRGQAI